jgi:1-acyl-sn-glycerol-3-phosphate acyltransferase
VGKPLYWLARLYLWLSGWSVEAEPPTCAKAVFIAAPHTSNWDMPHMLACAFAMRMRPSWAGKTALFRWPWGWAMRVLGGIAVDRRGKRDTVQQLADHFAARDGMYLAIAPEGTRGFTDHWKSGFYHVARAAGVPILCGYLDYSRKVGGIGPALEATDDVRELMDAVRSFYEPFVGRRPEGKGAIRLRGGG